jgi:hypothetical protein
VYAISITFSSRIHGQTVIEQALSLNSKLPGVGLASTSHIATQSNTHVLKTVPLRTGLRVDMKFIVESDEALRSKIFNGMVHAFATSPRIAETVHVPVKLDMNTMHNFLSGLSDGSWTEEIQCCIVLSQLTVIGRLLVRACSVSGLTASLIFDTRFVEDTPKTALRLTLHKR